MRDFGDGPVDRSVVLSGVFSSAAAAPPVRREGRAVADIVTAVHHLIIFASCCGQRGGIHAYTLSHMN